MDNQTFVSIIIPVHNGAQYLERCLSSISLSSYRFYEIIIVDDCSTDDSAEIARWYGVNVITLSHQSDPASARNVGSKAAKGDILFFFDSDIMIKQNTIARLI